MRRAGFWVDFGFGMEDAAEVDVEEGGGAYSREEQSKMNQKPRTLGDDDNKQRLI